MLAIAYAHASTLATSLCIKIACATSAGDSYWLGTLKWRKWKKDEKD